MQHFLKKTKVLLVALILAFLCLPAGKVKAAELAAPSTPVLTAAAKGKTVTLTWNQVKNATGYQIYLYYDSAKRFKCISTIKAGEPRSLTLKGSTDKTYRYKIRSYRRSSGKTACSAPSEELQVKTAPKKAVLTSVKRSKTSTVVSWQKIPSADGYQIVRAEKAAGPYKRVGVLWNNDSFKFADRSAPAGKNCYYKVRAFRRNPAVVYGSYSGVKQAEETADSSIIFIGDSRGEMLRYLYGNKEVNWLSKVSMGYAGLKSWAVPEAERLMTGKDKIVIWLGVNDVYNINNYISYINEITRKWENAGNEVYVMAVGQVEHDPYVTNPEIAEFNNKLKAGLNGAEYLDLYSYLAKNGYRTTDGAHYDNATNEKIYRYMLDAIQ